MGVQVLAMNTGLDGLEPFVLQDALNRDSSLGVGVQDLLHQLTGAKGQLLKGLIAIDSPHIQKVLKVGILGRGGAEGDTLVNHAVINDTTSPDIDPTGVILLVEKLLGSNVGL